MKLRNIAASALKGLGAAVLPVFILFQCASMPKPKVNLDDLVIMAAQHRMMIISRNSKGIHIEQDYSTNGGKTVNFAADYQVAGKVPSSIDGVIDYSLEFQGVHFPDKDSFPVNSEKMAEFAAREKRIIFNDNIEAYSLVYFGSEGNDVEFIAHYDRVENVYPSPEKNYYIFRFLGNSRKDDNGNYFFTPLLKNPKHEPERNL